jgi:hypothetical protein
MDTAPRVMLEFTTMTGLSLAHLPADVLFVSTRGSIIPRRHTSVCSFSCKCQYPMLLPSLPSGQSRVEAARLSRL